MKQATPEALADQAEKGARSIADTLRRLVDEAESLLHGASGKSQEGAEAARERFSQTLDRTRDTLSDWGDGLRHRGDSVRAGADQVRQRVGGVARAGTEYVSDHPISTILLVGAAAFLIGVLVGRAGDDDDYWS